MSNFHAFAASERPLLSRLTRYPVILGAVFSTLLFAAVVQMSVNERERDFIVAAKGAVTDFNEHVAEAEGLINNTVLLFDASNNVTEQEYGIFVDALMMQYGFAQSVTFLAHAVEDNHYALKGGSTWALTLNGQSLLLQKSYVVQHEGAKNSWPTQEDLNTANSLKAIAEALEQGSVAWGGLVTLNDGTAAFSEFKAVYERAGDGGRRLLGVIAALRLPDELLAHVSDSYQVNGSMRIGEQFVAQSFCCREKSAPLLPGFSHEHQYQMKGSDFHLAFSKGLGWDDIHLKLAVVAFVLGVLLSMMMYRLRVENLARTQMLMERNRTIKRQVEQQTRAVRQANTELLQQKAALDQHAIVSIADTSGNITYVNERFCEISGFHSDELVGRNHRIVKSDRHSPEFYEEMWHTISQGKVWHGEVCNRSKSGEEYWVNSTIVPFLDERGLPYQYVSIRTDVTALKAAKLIMSAHESEMNSILNTVPALIWYKDRDSNIVRANRAAAALAGLSPEEMSGRPHSDFFPAEAIVRYRADDLKVLESEEPLLDLRESLDSSDKTHHFRVDRVPYRDESGEVIGLIVMASDITRQEEAEQALLNNEERLRRSQTFANIGTWDWNIQTGDLYWSERIAPLFGYEVGALETTYENFLNAVHPDDRELVSTAVGACVETGAGYNIEHRVVWPDGQVRWLSEKGDVVRDENGAPLHMLGVVQDIHDRKVAEQALKDSEAALSENEEKFRSLYELSPVGIALNEMDGDFLDANQAFLDIVGYTAEECRNLTYWALTPDEYAPQEAEQLASLDKIGRYGPYEKEYCRKDGQRVPVLLSGTIVHDLEGKPRIWSIVQDIAERKQTEQELRASEERLLEAQQLARIGNWQADIVSGALEWSDVIYEIFGYEPQSFEPSIEAFKQAVHPDDVVTVAESERRARETGIHDVVHRIIRPDGEVRYVHELARSVLDDDGRLLRLVGTVQDVTEVKLAEQDLAIYRRIFDSTKQGIGVTDAQGDLVYSNRAHDEIHGYTHEEIVGKPFTTFFAEKTQAWAVDEILGAVQSGHGWSGLLPIMRKDGSELITSANVGFINDDEGKLQNIFNILSDYSPELLRQQQLQEAKETAEQASRAKSEFLSSMSHELRTPMNAILGFTQLIQGDDNLTAEQHESMDDIANAGNHLLELINEVLDLARIEAGKMDLSIGSVAIGDVIAASRNLITPMAERHHIQLVFSSSCFDGGFVRADFTRTKQVLLNLLSNAVKYNREGGRIQVDCQGLDNNRLRISVSDTGRGISEAKQGGLFEAFNRLDAGGGNIEGTGIGLVITRHLVELMGGEIGVESVVDEGSTFWFELPCAVGDVAKTGGSQREAVNSHVGLGAGRKVLYIEDNPVNLKLVSKLIEKRTAITLLGAEEPMRGIELAKEHRPDLILLDINLPEISGYEVLRRLREMAETRDIPVVALSANAMADDLQRGEAAGFDGYLTKPINVKEFFRVLEQMLG
jgi:PAS domain S-box-containing protein